MKSLQKRNYVGASLLLFEFAFLQKVEDEMELEIAARHPL